MDEEEELRVSPKQMDPDVIDALMSVGAYLKSKGLRKD